MQTELSTRIKRDSSHGMQITLPDAATVVTQSPLRFSVLTSSSRARSTMARLVLSRVSFCASCTSWSLISMFVLLMLAIIHQNCIFVCMDRRGPV